MRFLNNISKWNISSLGTALAQGVYVSEQNRRNAIDPDDVGRKVGGRQTEQLVVTARGQAQNLSTDFHKLQSLLESLPIFTGAGGSSTPAVADRRNELDQPIHGELYFRCKERFPVQPSPTPSSQPQVSWLSAKLHYTGHRLRTCCTTHQRTSSQQKFEYKLWCEAQQTPPPAAT